VTAILETDRLILRPFSPDDVDNLVSLDADPEVMRFINGGVPTPRHEIEREVLPHFLALQVHGSGYGFWAAEEKATGEFLGWFHLRPQANGRPDEPELGYRLKRSAWGRGYATEGSLALIQHAFAKLGARRVYAEAMAVHRASLRVMEKAGLRLVRRFHADWPVRIAGDEHGDVEYAITRDEWEQGISRPPRTRRGRWR
jgi:RimJ/RimL family protein N-acetyltransferase